MLLSLSGTLVVHGGDNLPFPSLFHLVVVGVCLIACMLERMKKSNPVGALSVSGFTHCSCSQ